MVGFGVFAVVLCTYGWTASPVIGWLDSPEFVAASSSLGVAHSPGHPIPLLLGRLASLFPVGDVAFRVNLASAFAGALAAWAVYLAAAELLRQIAPKLSKVGHLGASSGAGLLFAACSAAWLQGIRAEVYALQAALLAGTVAALLRYHRLDDRRWLALAGLLAGLALANHHLMAGLLLIPAAVFVFARGKQLRPGKTAIGATLMLGLLGLTALLYLPIRSSTHPEVNWAAPHTADRFAWTVSAKAFQKSAKQEFATSRSTAARQATWTTIENASEVMFLAGMALLIVAFRRREHRAVVSLLAGVVVCAIAGRAMVGFDPAVPDHQAYLLPAIFALVLLGIAGMVILAQWLPVEASDRAKERVKLGIVLVPLLLVPVQLVRHDAGRSHSDGYASDELARWELEELPPRSLVLLSYFQTSFRVSALRAVFHSRPDIAVLDRGLTYPGARAAAKRKYPSLAGLLDAGIHVESPLPLPSLQAVARTRPVFVQLDPLRVKTPTQHLMPAGPLARFLAEPVPLGLRRAVEIEDMASRIALVRRMGTPSEGDAHNVMGAMLWNDFLRLLFYCQAGRKTAAQAALDAALAMVPNDEQLAEEARRCGLTINR